MAITLKTTNMELIKVSNKRTTTATNEDLQKFESDLTTYAQTEGKQNGNKNQPVTEEQFRALIINHIEAHGQELINKNHSQYAPISGAVVATELRNKADEDISKLRSSLNEKEHSITQLENEKKRLEAPVKSFWQRKLPVLAIGLISVAEAYFIFEALRNSGFPLLPALIFSAGLGAGLAYYTHIVARYIKRAAEKKQAMLRALVTLIPIAILFYFIGHIRGDAYNEAAALTAQSEQLAVPSDTANGGKIGLISFLLYCIGLVIGIRYAKTKEETDKETTYDQACKKLGDEKKQKDAIKTQIQEIEKDTAEKTEKALATYEHALAREKQIQVICKKALEGYASTNMRNRTDGQCPVFFSNLPQLYFTSLFTHAKKDNQANEE
jgi:hypothetical protein